MSAFSPVNIDGDTPLHCCAQTGHWQLGERLLSVSGINVNVQNRDDETALFIASQLDHLGLVRSLIAANASTHLTDLSGLTPLDVAASNEVLSLLQESVRAMKASSSSVGGYGGSSTLSRSSQLQKQHSMGHIPSSNVSKSKSHLNAQSPSPPQATSFVSHARPSHSHYPDSISLSSSVPSGLGVTRERSGSSVLAQQARHRLMLMDEELYHSSSSGAAANGNVSQGDHGHGNNGDQLGATLSGSGQYQPVGHGESNGQHVTLGSSHGGNSAVGANGAANSNDSDRELETVPEDVENQVDRLGDELVDELSHLLEDTFILDAVSKITSSKSFKWRRTYSRTKIEVLKWLADYVSMDEEAHQAYLRHLKSKYPEAIKLILVRTPSAKRLNKKEKSQKKLHMLERKIKSYDWELVPEAINLMELIGNGSYGAVYRAILTVTGEEVAVKQLASDISEDDAATFMKEIAILSRLSHSSIVGFVGATITGTLALVMEYCSNGNLKQFLQQRQSTSWIAKLRLAREAAQGIAYLHAQFPPIVHRDLKCQNLLVNHAGNVRVSDFGLSKTISRTMGNASKMGTLNWLAPEVLRGEDQIHNTAVDVYAFGMVLYEILMDGRSPYESWQPLQIVRAIDEGLQPEIPDHCDADYRNLVEICWRRDAQDRPSMSFVMDRLSALEIDAVNALTVSNTPHFYTVVHHSHSGSNGIYTSSTNNSKRTASAQNLLKASSSSLPAPHPSTQHPIASFTPPPMARIESQPEILTSHAHNPNGPIIVSSPRSGASSLRDSSSALSARDAPFGSGNGFSTYGNSLAGVGYAVSSAQSIASPTTPRNRCLQHQATDSSLTSSVGSTTSTSSPATTPRDRDASVVSTTPSASPRVITPRSASFQLPATSTSSSHIISSSPSKSSSAIAITAAPTSPKKKDPKISFALSTSPSETRSSSLTLKSKVK